MIKVLYVNHKKKQCGVYEFGMDIGNLLLNSKKYIFDYCECDSFKELKRNYDNLNPHIIIYNYHPTTMGWVHPAGRFSIPVTFQLRAMHIGMIHDVYQKAADVANDTIFDFHISSDPTLLLRNPIVYKTNRLLPQQATFVPDNNLIPVIGSFGFATPGKGFYKIIDLVQKEFDEALIKLNIPFASFVDPKGTKAKEIAEKCQNLIYKKLIKLEISHNYLDKMQLISFLSSSSINVFLYDDQENRGISSATDWALASGRPLAISKSRLFRHLFNCDPSICIENNSLQSILTNGVRPIQHFWKEFSGESILLQYEKIIEDVIEKKHNRIVVKRIKSLFYLKKLLRKTRIAS